VAGEQVLVCPACQRDPGWRAVLDRCASCGSTHLAKALGLVVCRDCGARAERRTAPGSAPVPAAGGYLPAGVVVPAPTTEPEPELVPPTSPAARTELAADVEAALARMFGRGAGQVTERSRPPGDGAAR
jgi:hypothetical protein